MTRRFHGGVHPHDVKKVTAGSAVVELGAPAQVVLPLQQHVGAAAQAVVRPGDAVKKGQLIAESAGFVSARVHASIGGTVRAVEPRPHALGVPVLSVVIDGNRDESWAHLCDVPRDASKLDPAAIRQAVHDAGIVGLGGAAFPTHVKLTPPEGRTLDTLLLNGAECEPQLTADHRVMVEDAEKVLRGAELMMRTLDCTRCIVGIETNKPDAVDAMRRAAADFSGFSVEKLRVRYPAGGEKQLIFTLLGRVVPSGGLPLDVGVVVQNVATAAAVADAVLNSRPLIDRVITVAGDAVERPGNYRVRIGTSMRDMLDRAGVSGRMTRLVAGGPMMGTALPSADFPVIKGTTGLLAAGAGAPPEGIACIRCGRCVDVCPVDLNPSALSVLLEKQMVDEATGWDVGDCIECGCCAYICPSKRPIVQQIKFGKAELRSIRTGR
jgi:electron transport complex protein RnfC